MLAVTKVARDDLLTALHLSQDLVRDCAVLGMIIRNRDAGTRHHRDGTGGNVFADRLNAAQHPLTAAGILDTIEQSAIAFDELAAQILAEYQEKRRPLLDSIERARQGL